LKHRGKQSITKTLRVLIEHFYHHKDKNINKYKYHRRLNFGLAVYTAADLGAQL